MISICTHDQFKKELQFSMIIGDCGKNGWLNGATDAPLYRNKSRSHSSCTSLDYTSFFTFRKKQSLKTKCILSSVGFKP